MAKELVELIAVVHGVCCSVCQQPLRDNEHEPIVEPELYYFDAEANSWSHPECEKS